MNAIVIDKLISDIQATGGDRAKLIGVLKAAVAGLENQAADEVETEPKEVVESRRRKYVEKFSESAERAREDKRKRPSNW